MEDQCHYFASAMLLPAEAYSRELIEPTLNAFLTLKPRWKASIAGQIKRCEHLGILEPEGIRRMWINMKRRGWRAEEPLDDRLPAEEPRLLKRSINLVIESGLKTKSQMISDLGLNPGDVESLMCLPSGYFEDRGAESMEPQLKSKTVLEFGRPKWRG
jgi:Zn-dependent peptidase ImmA (M78 family)